MARSKKYLVDLTFDGGEPMARQVQEAIHAGMRMDSSCRSVDLRSSIVGKVNWPELPHSGPLARVSDQIAHPS